MKFKLTFKFEIIRFNSMTEIDLERALNLIVLLVIFGAIGSSSFLNFQTIYY